jgi:hypothetical protein
MTGNQVWLTILGGFIAGAVGVVAYLIQHAIERRDTRREDESEALREFSESLFPLLIELDRWRYNPDQNVVWVGASRQLPALRTWIFDPEENAQKPPDWDAIGQHGQDVERLWRDRLSAHVYDAVIDARWTDISGLLFHITLRSGADPRTAAERAEGQILELLELIQARLARGK